MANCNICQRELDQPNDPTTADCGGDCLKCMAMMGDEDCIRSLKEIEQPCCDEPEIVEAVDDNGDLIEPAFDICVNCGTEHR